MRSACEPFLVRTPDLTIKRDEAHRYYVDWGAGEVVLPSVSNIIAPIRDLSMIPPKVLADAAEHGKYVHSLTEIIDKERPNGEVLDEGSVLPFYKRYIGPWRAFREYRDLDPIFVEEEVAHRLQYGGTLDRVYFCRKDSCYYLADITVSKDLAPKFVQMAGYKAAFLDMYKQLDDFPMHLMAIHADNSGRFREEVMKDKDSVASWVTFMSCLNIWNWRKQHGSGR